MNQKQTIGPDPAHERSATLIRKAREELLFLIPDKGESKGFGPAHSTVLFAKAAADLRAVEVLIRYQPDLRICISIQADYSFSSAQSALRFLGRHSSPLAFTMEGLGRAWAAPGPQQG